MALKTLHRGDVVAVIDPNNPKYGDVVVVLRSDRNAWLVKSVATGDEYVPPVKHLARNVAPGVVRFGGR